MRRVNLPVFQSDHWEFAPASGSSQSNRGTKPWILAECTKVARYTTIQYFIKHIPVIAKIASLYLKRVSELEFITKTKNLGALTQLWLWWGWTLPTPFEFWLDQNATKQPHPIRVQALPVMPLNGDCQWLCRVRPFNLRKSCRSLGLYFMDYTILTRIFQTISRENPAWLSRSAIIAQTVPSSCRDWQQFKLHTAAKWVHECNVFNDQNGEQTGSARANPQ